MIHRMAEQNQSSIKLAQRIFSISRNTSITLEREGGMFHFISSCSTGVWAVPFNGIIELKYALYNKRHYQTKMGKHEVCPCYNYIDYTNCTPNFPRN